MQTTRLFNTLTIYGLKCANAQGFKFTYTIIGLVYIHRLFTFLFDEYLMRNDDIHIFIYNNLIHREQIHTLAEMLLQKINIQFRFVFVFITKLCIFCTNLTVSLMFFPFVFVFSHFTFVSNR